MRDTMLQRYASVRKHTAPAMPIVLLHIGEDQTGVASGMGVEPDLLLVLDMGASRTSTQFFKRYPPSPLEIETAIMAVEDEVTRARAVALHHAPLYSADERVRQMTRIVGGADGLVPTLRIEQVENLFDQLAARSEGRLPSQVQIPDDPRFAATLVILREFMHHLHFDTVQLIGSD